MSFYVQFEPIGDQIFRFDTRIYLNACDRRLEGDKECVAAIVVKNPGKAKSGSCIPVWEPLKLDGDNTLPLIRNLFLDAYLKADKPIPTNAFIQVWNLSTSAIMRLGLPLKH
jgi:hypothetical protein